MSSVPTIVVKSDTTQTPVLPKLTRRVGRPAKQRLAFSPARTITKLVSGPPSRLFSLTEMELEKILALCRCGTDAQTAAINILGVTRQTFNNWRTAAESEDGDIRYKKFFELLGQAVASRRAICSNRVADEDPLAWLTRGPGGKSLPDYPGWTPEPRRLDEESLGLPPVNLRVHIHVGRLGITSEVVRDVTPQVTEGDE